MGFLAHLHHLNERPEHVLGGPYAGPHEPLPDPGTSQLGKRGVVQEYRCPEDKSTLSRTEYEDFRSDGGM